jgi:hypothetical protein
VPPAHDADLRPRSPTTTFAPALLALAGVGRLLLAGLVVAAAAILCLKSYDWATKDDLPRDFGSFWESGRAANRGDDPYAVYPATFRVGGPQGPAAPNLNPPVFLYPFRLLGELSLPRAVRLWRSLSFGLYAVALAGLALAFPARRRWPFLAVAVDLAGFWATVELGQVYVPLLCLAVAGWAALRAQRDLAAGAAIGLLAALKPNLAVWPTLLLLGRRRRPGGVAVLAAATASAVPLVTEGPGVYQQWLRVTPSISDAAGGMARIGGDFSLVAMAGRFSAAPLGLVAAAALVVGLGWLALTRELDAERLSALALPAALLLGPVTWVGYSVLLLPVLAFLDWTPRVVLAAVLLCLPFWLVIDLGREGDLVLQLAQTLYGVGVLLLMAEAVQAAVRAPRRPLPRLAVARR